MGRVQEVLQRLEDLADPVVRAGYARFAIPQEAAMGIKMGTLRSFAKTLGVDHDLACALWPTGGYEARMVALLIADPARTDAALANQWISDIDNWAHVDTATSALFWRTPWRWAPPEAWITSPHEFVRRTPIALIWSLAVKDKRAPDERFLEALHQLEATDDLGHHYVEKAQDMAIRAVGKRNHALNEAAVALGKRLVASKSPARQRIGKSVLKELTSEKIQTRLRHKAAP